MQKNVKDDDVYTFVIRNETHFKNMCQWMKDLGVTKYMISCRVAFEMCEKITLCNVHLDDDGVVKPSE